MVLALYVLAGVMAAGGLAAIYSGSDIIVMERGWTMVIAGSVIAASGALLGGIATAVARLQNVEAQLARLSERLVRPQPPSLPAPDVKPERPAPRERPNLPSLAATPEVSAHRDLDIAPEPISSAPEPAKQPARLAPVPDAMPAPVREPPMTAVQPHVPVAAPESAPEPEPAVATQAPEEAPAPTIVGTYNSGGNFYVMYSDGSIEAETPAGKFRFDSLDELKEFIAAGGDKAKATS